MSDTVKIVGVEGGFGGNAHAGFLSTGATARLPTESEFSANLVRLSAGIEAAEAELLVGLARSGEGTSLPMGGWVMSPLGGALVSPESAAKYESEGSLTRFPGSPLEVTDSASRFGYAVFGVQPVFGPLWDVELCRRLGGAVGGPWPLAVTPVSVGVAGEMPPEPSQLSWGALVFGDYHAAKEYVAQASENAYQELLRTGLWKLVGDWPSPLCQALLLNVDHTGLTAMDVAMSSGKAAKVAQEISEVILGRDEILNAPGGVEMVRTRIERFRAELHARRLDLAT